LASNSKTAFQEVVWNLIFMIFPRHFLSCGKSRIEVCCDRSRYKVPFDKFFYRELL